MGRYPASEITIGGSVRASWLTVTFRPRVSSAVSVAPAWLTLKSYSPAATSGISYDPSRRVIAKYGVASTAIMALIEEWMLQNTRTTPARVKRTERVEPGGYSPMSKTWPL